MRQYKIDFFDSAIGVDALKFGRFELKSGRNSPYFFDTGMFTGGKSLNALGQAYAAMLNSEMENRDFKCESLFGPAYKGITLAASTAISLATRYNHNIPYAYDRKEEKDHGEGGIIVGSVSRSTVIIDDVTTDGATKREAFDLVRIQGGGVSAIALAFDRQELGKESDLSAAQALERDLEVPVVAIATLNDLIEYLRNKSSHEHDLSAILKYQEKYGV